MRNWLMAGLLALMVTTLVSSGAANGGRPGKVSSNERSPVTVAIVPALEFGGERSVIMRGVSLPGSNAVGLADVLAFEDGFLNAVTLTEAVSALLTVRLNFGESVTEAQVHRIRPGSGARDRGDKGAGRRAYPWAQRIVEMTGDADVTEVPGLGAAKVMEIWLPKQKKPKKVKDKKGR